MQATDWRGVIPANHDPLRRGPGGGMRPRLSATWEWLIAAGCAGVVTLGLAWRGTRAGRLRREWRSSGPVRAPRAGGCPVARGRFRIHDPRSRPTRARVCPRGCGRADGAPALRVSRRLAWRRGAHLSAVLEATPLSCMLYNNPIAYGTDSRRTRSASSPHARQPHAVKESSGDVRRVSAIHALVGIGCAFWPAWTTPLWRAWEWARSDGSPGW